MSWPASTGKKSFKRLKDKKKLASESHHRPGMKNGLD